MNATGAAAGQGLFRLYVLLAVAGAIFPYLLLVPWLAEHGLAPGLFLSQLFPTVPATIGVSDALYSAAVFVLFVIAEGRRLGMRRLWLPIGAMLTFGLCCGLPLFLAMREKALDAT